MINICFCMIYTSGDCRDFYNTTWDKHLENIDLWPVGLAETGRTPCLDKSL